MPTRKKASQTAPARKGARPAARAEKKPAAKPKAGAHCAATTQKGTPCRLKPQDGSIFCARHADAAAESATASAPPPVAATRAKAVPAEAKNGRAGRPKPAKKTTRKQRVEAPLEIEHDAPTPQAVDGPIDGESEKEEGDVVPEAVEDPMMYGSEWSSTLEASPWDEVTPQMAAGEDDVELVEEDEMGAGGAKPRREEPRMSREEAEKQAAERLGPRPELSPEEDLDGLLADYDRRFESEVRYLMGMRRKRGRRGGRRRQGHEGGAPQGGAGPQGGRKRRGRRGGRRRREQGGGGGESGGVREDPPVRRARPVGRRGPRPGLGKIARDSPLAERRGSSGPKRGVQPRRRREPDV